MSGLRVEYDQEKWSQRRKTAIQMSEMWPSVPPKIGADRSIESRGYCIKGIVIDGMRSLFREFARYLFTFQREECAGMPNTNNKLEGTITDLKKNLNLHSGLSLENRKRFIRGFFLAWNEI